MKDKKFIHEVMVLLHKALNPQDVKADFKEGSVDVNAVRRKALSELRQDLKNFQVKHPSVFKHIKKV